jgi:hypothetical protein
MRIKGGHYKEWAVDRTIQEGPRADYAAKKTTKSWFGQLNKEARLTPGHLPHMPPGHVFYARAEMEVLGFHAKQMNGIDYCSTNNSKYAVDDVPMAYALTGNSTSNPLCCVTSGLFSDRLRCGCSHLSRRVRG